MRGSYYDTYIESVQNFARLGADYGAEVLLSNHSEFDNAYYRANVVANRDSTTEYDPFVVGQRDVLDYLGTIELSRQGREAARDGQPLAVSLRLAEPSLLCAGASFGDTLHSGGLNHARRHSCHQPS